MFVLAIRLFFQHRKITLPHKLAFGASLNHGEKGYNRVFGEGNAQPNRL